MTIPRASIALIIVLFCIWPAEDLKAAHGWSPPPQVPPYEYGNVLMSRAAGKDGVKPVWFSHWSHRRRYACRVCHLELGFAFEKNHTEITESDNKRGLFCGACHNGKQAFGHDDRADCSKCHGNAPPSAEQFEAFAKNLPRTPYGNQIDWVKALSLALIQPVYSLYSKEDKALPFDEDLELKATAEAPPVYFPHDKHLQWLDCAACHPRIFNIKKKVADKKVTVEQIRMARLLKAQFCGVCHLKVAFPINDCKRCHKKGVGEQSDEE